MKPKSKLRSFLALAGSSLLVISYSQAAPLYWDGNDTTGFADGGNGNWDNALTNWDTLPGAGAPTAWAAGDIAVFGGTAGTATLTDDVTVGGLRFNTTNYLIDGNTNSRTLTFADGNNSILLGTNGVTAATIRGPLAGSSSANVSVSNAAGVFANSLATLTLGRVSTGGWGGTSTINAGITLSLVDDNRGLASTSGITLNGGFQATTQTGGILITNTSATQAGYNRVNDSAAIVSNGGFITVTNTASATTVYSETMGALDLRNGQLNVTQTNANTNDAATQTLTFGSGSLTTVNGSSPRTNATRSAINFSGNNLGANVRNTIKITGQADTNQNEIIAPWVTYGSTTTAGTMTDYAVYNRAGSANASTNALGVQAANITADAESAWSTAHDATSNYTLNNALGTAAGGRLSATRSINTLRSTTARTTVNSIASNVITITGHAFQDNDVLVTTANQGPGGLARDTAYYVVNAGTDTFQLATTPGGAPVTVSGKNFLTSGITLASGNNLETYGLLSATANANLVVGRGTAGGTVSTPTGGGNLYLTTGAAGMVIDAPITDNGGAVTVVRNGGAGRLVLSGNNTFTGGLVVNGGGAGAGVLLSGTQSFTGGITLNGGGLGDHSNSLPGVTNAALNGNAITVNGAAHLIVTNGQTLGTGNTITINSAGALSLGSSGTVTVSGVVSGSGLLDLGANSLNGSSTVNLTNTANTFTGNVIFANQHGGTLTLNAASLGDNGKVTFGLGNSANTQVFALHSDANATVNFNTRQFELAGTASTVSRIANNSAQAFNISTDLLTSGTGTRTLQLYGTGAGVSTFAGDIANGSLTSLGIAKAESGTWALSGDNTYTGDTAVSAGTLLVNNTTGSGTGAGNVSVSAGTIGGTGSISGNVTIGNSTGSADSILAPGTGIGSLATGNLAFNSDGRYAVELNGTSVTTDVTNVTGTVTIDPAATLTVNVAGTLSAGQQFVIVANDGVDPVSGTFAGLAEGDVAGTDGVTDLKISYTGGTGNDIVLYTDGVPGGDDYSTWATANGIDGEAFGDDFDNDGISNGVEYALGLDPTTSSQPAGVLSGNTITFTKGSDAITNADVSWIIETSTTLEVGSWTDEVTQAAGDASATISYTFTPGTPAKKFARLKVVQVP